ncbi:MAG: prenyltransferase [Burkholderiaceae bacterium]
MRWLRLLRLPFVSVTVVACALGLAAAVRAGAPMDAGLAVTVVGLAALVHLGANVVNDYFDARNGSDAINTERVAPFTGGSRVLQDGDFAPESVRAIGAGLLAVGAIGGLWLATRVGVALVPVGVAGVALAWAYSAPPLALMSRGLGELGIALAWGLVVIGAAITLHPASLATTYWVAPGYAATVAAILFINTFPDRHADSIAGKRTLVVRLGPGSARAVYPLILLLAYLPPIVGVAWGELPVSVLYCLGGLPLSLVGAHSLWRHSGAPARLRGAIVATILASLAYGTGAALGLAS